MLQLDVSHYLYLYTFQLSSYDISAPMKTRLVLLYINIFRPPAKELLPLSPGVIFVSNDHGQNW